MYENDRGQPLAWKARRRNGRRDKAGGAPEPGELTLVEGGGMKMETEQAALDDTWEREDVAGPADGLELLQAVERGEARLREARRRSWAADTACYYAHRRYTQSRSDADRLLWRTRTGESERAVAEVDAAEQALGRAQEAASAPRADALRMRVVRLRGGGHGLSS